jgi:uncharacterized membrane protein YvlD (DUF360 family)
MRSALRLGWRFFVTAVINSISLWLVALLVPGIALSDRRPATLLWVAGFALLIGLANALIRPMLVYLMLPVNILTVGLPTIVLDSVLLDLLSTILHGFRIESFWPSAVFGAVVLPLSNIILTTLTNPERQRTLYEWIVRRLNRNAPRSSAPAGRGLLILQIDGLPHATLQRALRAGKMPTLQRLLDSGEYRLTLWNCGVPSGTSAFQAGILYGDNFDIPAFRWFDRRAGRVFVSYHPDSAQIIQQRCATRPGLLRGGSSINTLLSGDAAMTMFTVSTLQLENHSLRVRDFLLFLLNPYCLLRVLGLALWDLLMEYAGRGRQRLSRPPIRVSRDGYYPLLRVISNVLLREVSTYLAMLDIMRGVPAIYVSYLGFDEICHYTGPGSVEVFEPLAGIDNQIMRIVKTMRRSAPIPYDLVILSDHGQSPSLPFTRLFGQPLSQMIQSLMRNELSVGPAAPQREPAGWLVALIEELRQAERSAAGRLLPRAVRSGRRALQELGERASAANEPAEPDILALCSGNLAHIYFERSAQPLTLEEIEAQYPGLLAALARHAGIGFILGRSRLRGPLIIGPDGYRQLATGNVVGVDPLAQFADASASAGYLARLLQFPNAGDLVLNGAILNGRVVSFEEHLGTHGGLGGGQNYPFVVFPADMGLDAQPPDDARQFYALLAARRARNGAGAF